VRGKGEIAKCFSIVEKLQAVCQLKVCATIQALHAYFIALWLFTQLVRGNSNL
jgi:hypothetical protein